ncbi:interphotoreceptor retinoid-binding protein [Catellatospora sp. TT07R-123]|uniref:S41 family peptidase n=1 Tax=Catellatospora sp. TT07R-123 TaxID=2733863 RepID=UPI001B0C94B2|nr:S41 family peptidase [Catellatospora sp. TT07R-123]GHJ49414.1 interphotoreceptor retinoid-binding protein [Catellatospora sp. TT07R-123]
MPRQVVDRALTLMCAHYVFPERAVLAAANIRERLDAGRYDGLDEAGLAERLGADLRELCADQHLRLRVRRARPANTEADVLSAYREQLRADNHRISRVERLDGNVGYIDLRGVTDPAVGGRAVAAAMELVSHTCALLLDLRHNRGGSPDGAVFWSSYFFPDSGTHLNSVESAETGATRQYWSLAYLPGERYLDRPVYVLTGPDTFSAGEEICYNLKAQGRAVLVGEPTAGGAHPARSLPLSPTLELTVPYARSVNPVTGTNWEAVGVEPDVPVPAGQAYATAYRAALEHVLATATVPGLLDEARAALAAL